MYECTYSCNNELYCTLSFVDCAQVDQPNASTKSFTFNVTFEPAASQEDIFENSGVKKLVEMAVEGFVIIIIIIIVINL